MNQAQLIWVCSADQQRAGKGTQHEEKKQKTKPTPTHNPPEVSQLGPPLSKVSDHAPGIKIRLFFLFPKMLDVHIYTTTVKSVHNRNAWFKLIQTQQSCNKSSMKVMTTLMKSLC